jgi:hypothetical protein
MQETEEEIDRAVNKGLRYNVQVEPENVLYVTAEEILEGLNEPGEFYWKKEGGPMRVHNISHLQGLGHAGVPRGKDQDIAEQVPLGYV